MEPAPVRALWFQRGAEQDLGAQAGQLTRLSLWRGAQAVRVGSACAMWTDE